MTRGSKGSNIKSKHGDQLANIRTKEAEMIYANLIGVQLHWMEFVDGEVQYDVSSVDRVVSYLREKQVDMVYLPELPPRSQRSHNDHDNTARLVLDAIFHNKLSPVIRHYHSQNPSVYVDISRNYWKNMKHLKCYKSQYKWHAPWVAYFGILRHFECRRLGKKNGFRYAEGFRQVIHVSHSFQQKSLEPISNRTGSTFISINRPQKVEKKTSLR